MKKQKKGSGKISAVDFIEEERKALSPQERKLLKILTKRNKGERFERCVV